MLNMQKSGLRETIRMLISENNIIDDVYYHGSNNYFSQFDLVSNKMYNEIDLPVWFFTKDLDYAKSYGKYVYKVKLNIHKIFDTSNKKHFKQFISYLKNDGKKRDEIDVILDEQFYKDLPYWTCDDAFYCAASNDFDSIIIAEELDSDVESIGVFNREMIEIIDVQ